MAARDDLQRVDAGTDLVHAELALGRLRRQGVRAELLRSGAGGIAPDLASAEGHAFLVASEDADRVREILSEHEGVSGERTVRGRRRRVVRLVALVFVVLILAAVLSSLVSYW
ncbi:MAG: hypothetical protein GY720_22950 [bacterium]|nr:hypothetical protein [bacterium]